MTSDSALGAGIEQLVQSSGSDIQRPGFKSPRSHLLHVTQQASLELQTGEMTAPPNPPPLPHPLAQDSGRSNESGHVLGTH